MYGGMASTNYINGLLSLVGMCNAYGIDFYWKFIHNESLVTKARNDLAQAFIENKEATHILFIDSDIGFNAEDVFKMIQEDVDFIGGVYPKKQIYWENVSSAARKGISDVERLSSYSMDYVYKGEPFSFGDSKSVEAEFLGFGFILLKKEVFKKLIPETKRYTGSSSYPVNKKIYAFFDTAMDEKNNDLLLSEDFYFCKRWRDLGGKIYAAPWVHLTHSGNYTFSRVF